ncbi:MAG: hypothetical protein RL701_4930, partial [Pseudomonadota bacterium]
TQREHPPKVQKYGRPAAAQAPHSQTCNESTDAGVDVVIDGDGDGDGDGDETHSHPRDAVAVNDHVNVGSCR